MSPLPRVTNTGAARLRFLSPKEMQPRRSEDGRTCVGADDDRADVERVLAGEIAANCISSTGLALNTSFAEALNAICRWPDPAAQSPEAMQAFWIALMGYDAPEEEFLAWRQFFIASSFAKQPASVAVPEMAFALMYNPNFLLSRGN